MSSVKEQLISEWIASTPKESDLYSPIAALLRAEGASAVHIVHGPSEFGADIIARRTVERRPQQLLIQVKRGDLNHSSWRAALEQARECFSINTRHPDFDADADRLAVIAISGTLKGNAPIVAAATAADLEKTSNGKRRLEIWTAAELTERLSADHCLGGALDWKAIGSILYRLEHARATDTRTSGLEFYQLLARCSTSEHQLELLRSFIDAELSKANLGFERISLIYSAITAHLASLEPKELRDQEPKPIVRMRAALLELVDQLITECTSNLEGFLLAGEDEIAQIVTPSVRGNRALEAIATMALAADTPLDLCKRAEKLSSRLASVGAIRRPLSDNYSASVLLTALLLRNRHTELDLYLEGIAEWIVQSYDGEGACGLAPPHAGEYIECLYTVSSYVDHPEAHRRSTSILATAVLDAATLLGRHQTYKRIHRRFVNTPDLAPERRICTPRLSGGGLLETDETIELGGQFSCKWPENNEPCSSHGQQKWLNAWESVPPALDWSFVVASLTFRDRWWYGNVQRLVQLRRPQDVGPARTGKGG